ncbi:MAG: hypothetical protein EBQ99_07005 [Planctomycetes bacterium]|nr:hypothetical protein [Planctomycetota bacterium]
MLARRLLVRLTLGALAAAAISGVAVLFAPGWAVSGRLAVSAASTVVACALLMAFSGHEEGGRSTPVQLAWATWVTGLLVIFLAFLWFEARLPGGDRGALLWAWSVYGLGAFVVAFPALRERGRPAAHTWQWFEVLSVIGAGSAFITGSVFMLVRPWTDMSFLGGMLALTLAMGLGLAAICAVSLRTGPSAPVVGPRDRMWARVGVAMALATTAAWIILLLLTQGSILLDPTVRVREPSPDFAAGATVGLAVTLAITLWSVLHPMRLQSWGALLPHASGGLTLLLGAMIAAIQCKRFDLALDGWGPRAYFGRAVYAVLLLDICTLLTIPIAIRMARSMRGSRDFVRPVHELRSRCPRCRTTATLQPGFNACMECGLVTLLDFRDDRCPGCDYDLRGAHLRTCPECGRERQMPLGHPA